MMQGMLGQPEGGWPKVLQKIILDSAGAKPIKGRPGAKMPHGRLRGRDEGARRQDRSASRRDEDVLSYLMYPQVFLDFEKHVAQYGDTSASSRRRRSSTACRPGEEISVEIERGQDADHQAT